jgi:DNA-binding NarL/FixJ family response regulator
MAVSERVSEALAEKLVRGAAAQAGSPVEALSDRELEVFRLVGEGRTTRQIADALHLSFKTVQAYYARIKTKLGAVNGVEMLRDAIRWNEEQGGR